jgi:hypothetical protein
MYMESVDAALEKTMGKVPAFPANISPYLLGYGKEEKGCLEGNAAVCWALFIQT